MRVPALFVAAVLLLTGPAAAHDTDPGISPSFALFPQHEEVQQRLAAAAAHPFVSLEEVGRSNDGRPLQLAIVADPNATYGPAGPVVVFLVTQQHGNEPAGTPAVLDILDRLAGGDLADVLEDVVVLILPQANPDGALLEQRGNVKDVDLNRDHIGLTEPETRALHKVLTTWDVHIAVDHHEYGGLGFGNPVPVRLYDYDLTTLFPRHGNVQAPTQQAAESLMYDGIWPVAEAAGYSSNEYGEQTVAGVPVQEVAGGPDPGILRNNFGLYNVAGLLVETRVDQHPNPFHDAERRTDIHRVVMEATLRHAAQNADSYILAKRGSEQASVASPATRYVEGETTGELPEAFVARGDAGETMAELLALHGLPAPAVRPDGALVHNLDHDRIGLAAALLSEHSSRQAVAASPGAAFVAPVVQEAEPEEEAPGPAAALLGLALVALAFAVRRRS